MSSGLTFDAADPVQYQPFCQPAPILAINLISEWCATNVVSSAIDKEESRLPLTFPATPLVKLKQSMLPTLRPFGEQRGCSNSYMGMSQKRGTPYQNNWSSLGVPLNPTENRNQPWPECLWSPKPAQDHLKSAVGETLLQNQREAPGNLRVPQPRLELPQIGVW